MVLPPRKKKSLLPGSPTPRRSTYLLCDPADAYRDHSRGNTSDQAPAIPSPTTPPAGVTFYLSKRSQMAEF